MVLDAAGELSLLGGTTTGDFPSFAALAPSGAMVVVNEASDQVASLSIAPGTGTATLVSTIASEGSGPTHVSVHGSTAYVANYGDGSVAALALDGDRLDRAIDEESAGRNAHEVVVDPSGRWLLVPCKGDDVIVVFEIAADGTLTRLGEHDIASGAGPRHLAFDRAGTTAYLVTESASTIDVLAFDPSSGALTTRQTLSTVPASFAGTNTGSEVLVSPDGRFVYASNRGHDSIAIFAVLPDATLEPRGHAMLDARSPRSMTIDPSGAFLIAGAFDSDVLVRFRIERDGSLTRLGATPIDSPWYVGAFAIPER
jgi:6-phosphogluconolactonase